MILVTSGYDEALCYDAEGLRLAKSSRFLAALFMVLVDDFSTMVVRQSARYPSNSCGSPAIINHALCTFLI